MLNKEEKFLEILSKLDAKFNYRIGQKVRVNCTQSCYLKGKVGIVTGKKPHPPFSKHIRVTLGPLSYWLFLNEIRPIYLRDLHEGK